MPVKMHIKRFITRKFGTNGNFKKKLKGDNERFKRFLN
jgi:hypothetical protein